MVERLSMAKTLVSLCVLIAVAGMRARISRKSHPGIEVWFFAMSELHLPCRMRDWAKAPGLEEAQVIFESTAPFHRRTASFPTIPEDAR